MKPSIQPHSSPGVLRAALAQRLVFLLAVALGAPACTVATTGTMSTTTPIVYQEPPQEQVESVTVRPGYIWAKGRWDWQSGQWVWIGGHWERQRASEQWQAGRWERRGNAWHWLEGRWVAGASVDIVPPPEPRDRVEPVAVTPVAPPMYPTAAPPPPRTENTGAARAGYVWIGGRWDWQGGNWQWLDGHWERQQANQAWVPGRWELQGNYYVWVEGRWDRAAPAGPVIRDHR